MRFFEFETYLTSDEIQHRMSSYYEWEKHSSWNIFKEYTSPRKGLHLYPDENGFTGYYETGERNRHYDLQRAKAWMHCQRIYILLPFIDNRFVDWLVRSYFCSRYTGIYLNFRCVRCIVYVKNQGRK